MGTLGKGLRPLRIALGFLTRLPAGRLEAEDWVGELGRSAWLFPLAGLAVGMVVAAVDAVAGLLFGRAVRAAIAVAAGLWVTGGLHLDGLMDAADALGSGRSREQMLAILKDSRVGAMGAAAGALALLVRAGLLLEIPGDLLPVALLVAPALGRMAITLAAGLLPPHPAGAGLGAAFSRQLGPARASGAAALGLGLAVLVPAAAALAAGGTGLGVALGGALLESPWLLPALARSLAAWVAAAGASLLAGRVLAARLGGLTGDTLGAICELAEMAALGCFAALAGGGGL
ncbi:MAG: adenosylcobinamide-GDP ribazoletransferase [Firmicutes bacterium]|nr:adenosylcobinamide-GDP ribazoletransferase [Bacillota bacterium]